MKVWTIRIAKDRRRKEDDSQMGFEVVFTKPAIADLEALVTFISRDNPWAAEQFGSAIIEKAEQLSGFPFLGRVVPEFRIEDIREVIRKSDSLRHWGG